MNRAKLNTETWVILGGGFLSGIIANYARNNKKNYMLLSREIFDLADEKFVDFGRRAIPIHSNLIVTASVTRLRGNSYRDFIENIKISENILLLNEYIRGHVIFFSTVDVYGNAPVLPITEASPIAPQDFYSLSKIVSEFSIAISFEAGRDGPWTIFRLSGLYGCSFNNKSPIQSMIESSFTAHRIKVYGGGEVLRDYVWADDVAAILDRAISWGAFGVFNVATGHSRSIREIAGVVAAKTNGVVDVIHDSVNHSRGNSLAFDIGKFKSISQFESFAYTSLDCGIDNCIAYYRQCKGL